MSSRRWLPWLLALCLLLTQAAASMHSIGHVVADSHAFATADDGSPRDDTSASDALCAMCEHAAHGHVPVPMVAATIGSEPRSHTPHHPIHSGHAAVFFRHGDARAPPLSA
ncbi:hypothetical protein ACDA63_14645 [Uliginosibacterium sp. sgz301328]|uniref:hypothetical protein n=1 Tax=Uliginosibacterium sp. sgz301328 TaxID=3243764 RepID=UPI00359E77BF